MPTRNCCAEADWSRSETFREGQFAMYKKIVPFVKHLLKIGALTLWVRTAGKKLIFINIKYFVLLVQHIALRHASRQRNVQDTLMKMKKTLHAPVLFYFRPTPPPPPPPKKTCFSFPEATQKRRTQQHQNKAFFFIPSAPERRVMSQSPATSLKRNNRDGTSAYKTK